MNKTRLIHYTGKDGREGLSTEEDMSVDVNDLIPYGCTLVSETIIEVPSSFPSNHQFEKIN